METNNKKKMGTKKKVLIAIIALLVLAAIAVAVYFIAFKKDKAENSDADLEGDAGEVMVVPNYYSGVVEPQQTANINKDAERTISQVYVSVGDVVKKGDKLFSYDVKETSLKLDQAKLERDGISNEISGYVNQINDLTKQRSQATEDMQLEYTIQIQEAQSSKSQAELNLQMKNVEIENLEKSTKNADVVSPIDGIVKSVNNNAEGEGAETFITILKTDSYQIKTKVDEMSIGMLSEGMPVTVKSRADESKTWSGTITKIDTDNQATEGNDMYADDQGAESATSYYFYVSVDTSEGLLIGQHVYVEPQVEDMEMPEEDMEAVEDGEAVPEEEVVTDKAE